MEFIESVRVTCEAKLLDDFSSFTNIVDWDLMTGLSELTECASQIILN
jgi:hypothetical protein